MTPTRWLCIGLIAPCAAPAAAQEGVQMKVSKDAVDIAVNGTPLTRYSTAGYAKPIFYPLFAPGGQPLTRDWPMKEAKEGQSKDHPHQKSAWFCHGDVIPEGVQLKDRIKGVDGVDFWSEAKGHGNIVTTKVGEAKVAKDHASLPMHLEWQTADGTKIMDEDRTIHVYDLGTARLIVVRIDLLASVAPITFGDTKEGAFGIRINDTIRAGKLGAGKIQNAEGKVGEKEAWGRLSAWCDYSGPIDGKTVGLAVLADPKNAYPTYWHVRDYGLMAANPFGRKKAAFHDGAADKELVKLARGEHLRLRYGILVHNGDAEAGQVAQQYERFAKLRAREE